MSNTKIEKSSRSNGHMSFPEYRLCPEYDSSDIFHVIKINDMFCKHPECLSVNHMHTHDFNLIIWTKEGRGIHYVDFNKYEIKEDTLFFLSPKNFHYYELSNTQNGYIIVFSTDFIQHLDQSIFDFVVYTLFSHTRGSNHCIVPPNIAIYLQSLINLMVEEDASPKEDFLHKSYLASLFTLFLTTAIRKCQWKLKPDTNNSHQSFKHYHSFLEHLEKNFTKTHSVKDYAKYLGISICLLSKYTKMYENATPLEIIDRRIVLEAKRLLRYTPMRIKEIATELGFDDPSYFNKFFKRQVGMTPTDFKIAYIV